LDDLSKVNVVAAIVISDSELSSVIGTPQECVDLFKNDKNIFVIGGISPLIDYKARLSQLEELLFNQLIVGLKLYPGHETFYMDDSRLDRVFQLCIKYDVPLAVHTGWDNAQYNHPKFFAKIAEDYPDLRIVICHLYWPNIDFCYEMTSTYPNIYYDISSLAYETECLEKTRVSLNRIAKRNVERIVFGSDYGACKIKDHIDLVESLDLEKCKKQLIYHDNAVNLYKLKL